MSRQGSQKDVMFFPVIVITEGVPADGDTESPEWLVRRGLFKRSFYMRTT